MPDLYLLWLGGSSSIMVGGDTLHKWCPALLDCGIGMHIDATGLVDAIDSNLSFFASRPPSEGTTRKTLKELFNYWDPNVAQRRGLRTRDALRAIINEQMHGDIEIRSSLGLGRSRFYFLVYCLLARETGSSTLAEVIAEYFEIEAPLILANEKHKFRMEWYYGIQVLQGLLPHSTWMEIIRKAPRQSGDTWPGYQGEPRQDPHLAWILYQMAMKAQQNALSSPPQRGRSSRRDGRIEGSPRAASLPPINSYSVACRPSMATGISNPVWPTFVDQVNQLHWNQEEMNLKLDRIDSKLDCLLN